MVVRARQSKLGPFAAGAARVAAVEFFFQAEDGIRDYKVTGVQTCALPILLATMRANSARPSPIPECSGACAGTLPTAPPALTLVYPDIVRCERVAVAAVVWNLDGGNLAAAVSARERNDERVISRNRAPATNQHKQ